MEGYLKNDLWIKLAKQANSECQNLLAELKKIPDVEILHPTQANLIFALIPEKLHTTLSAKGAKYNFWTNQMLPNDVPKDKIKIRLACSWSTTKSEIDHLLELLSNC
jgi:threonine aldolase